MPIPVKRRENTSKVGSSFSDAVIAAVWSKGEVDPRYSAAVYRKDVYGSWMKRENYGTLGQYGWEVDHIKPVAAGGTDELSNLQPLYWENNRRKGDSY
jgi:hypothetical protein